MDRTFRIFSAAFFFVFSVSVFAQNEAESWDHDGRGMADDTVMESEEDYPIYLEEVHVTGTRILRRDFYTPSPLTTVDKEIIEYSPQLTIEETLNQMPQMFPSDGRTANFTGDGTATIDLRGLGAGRTLVLLNGRRLAPTGTGNEVDLNNIPRFLLERVEIITGGTSAVYGSDAIAGVVNFITVGDFEGYGAEASYYVTGEGDANTYDLGFAYGYNFANGRGNITFYASWLDREALYGSDREVSSNVHADYGDGTLGPYGSWSTPAGVVRWPYADLGNGAANVTFNKDGTPREFPGFEEAYNYNQAMYIQVSLTRYSLGATGHHDLSDRFEGYFEASFTRNEPTRNLAPAAAWKDLEINLDNPVLAPEARQLFTDFYSCDENLACISFSKRFAEFGQRLAEYRRDYARIVAGFRGELGRGWDIDAWVTYTNASSRLDLSNSASYARYLQGMLVDPLTNQCYDPGGGCVPLNVFGEENLSPEAIEFLRYSAFRNTTERRQMLASAYVTGSPFDTWAGSFDMAAGIDWRRDDTEFRADEAFLSGDILGWEGTAPVVGVEDVYEVYAEAVIPLMSERAWAQHLELEIGARYSDYERAGGVWTYKAGGSWQPFDSLRLRAMFQRSTRAPNSTELFREQSVSYGRVIRSPSDDPCSASADPVANGNVEKCLLQGLPESQIGVFEATKDYVAEYTYGGNPYLDPETGETWTVGAIFTPGFAPGLTLSVDYFDLEVTDTIGDISSFDICFDELNTGNVFCDNLRRGPSGNIDAVTNVTSNRGLAETTGIDTQVHYRSDLPNWLAIGDHSSDVTFNLYWTHYFTHKSQENPVTTIYDCAGYFGWPCDLIAYPENRLTSTINYRSGPLGMHLTWRWIEGTRNGYWFDPFFSEEYPPAIPELADKNYLGLGFSYDFNDRLRAYFLIANLTDTGPPQMALQAATNNTDLGLYDVFGRSYLLRLSAHF
jgi:outer membrane receptor protein involved in Fe transport